VLLMAEFLRLPNFKGCQITVSVLLPPGTARTWLWSRYHAGRYWMIKKRKRRKLRKKAAVKSPAVDILAEKVGINKHAGKDGPRKKRKVRARPQVQPVSKHTDEHVTPPHAIADEHATEGEAHKDANTTFADEGHGDNKGGLSGLKTQPTPICHSGQHLETVEKLVCDKVVPDEEASYSAGRFGNLCFAPQWGLTNPGRMDNSYECRDMMSNLFTPADHEFFNEGVRDESAIRRSWKMLCQSAQQQANTLLCFEALTEEHADLVYAHESCKDVKARYKDCQKELAKVQAAYDRKVFDYDMLSKNYEGALVREKSTQERLEELEEEKKEVDQLDIKQLDRIWQLEEALKQFEAEADQL
ncbi:hypothetical protein Tco_1565493, partial [Tanacetum coccineum]